MRRLAAFCLCAALTLPAATSAQGYRILSGSVTYMDRMALPPDAVVLIEVVSPDLALEAELRMPTDGAQVPLPFRIEVPEGIEASLRAGILSGTTLIRLTDAVPLVASGPSDLGQLVARPVDRGGLDTSYRCGSIRLRTGLAGDGLALDTGPGSARLILGPVPAASGTRFELTDDPTTYFWSQGDGARAALLGVELPECRVSLPAVEATYRATGNEPFWSVRQAEGVLTLSWLGFTELTLPIVETTLDGAGAVVVTGFDAVQAQRAVLTRTPAICRDTMTGLPYPEAVSLTISMPMGGDTLTGCGGAPADLLTGRTWVVEDIAGAGIVDASRVTLGFGTDGRVAGAGGCNRWFAGYELTGEGLSIGQAGSTMMACAQALMDQERRFFEVLAQVNGFDIDGTGALVLMAAGQPVVTARAATDGSAP